jgi:hypothetical protein
MSVDTPQSRPPTTVTPKDRTGRSEKPAEAARGPEAAAVGVRDLLDRSLEASDGNAGKLSDLLFDDARWEVRYLVVRAGSRLFGREVLVSPEAVRRLPGPGEPVQVRLSREQVKESPGRSLAPPVSEQVQGGLEPYNGWPAHGHDPHLRSARQVLGYQFRTRDGEVGRVADFRLQLGIGGGGESGGEGGGEGGEGGEDGHPRWALPAVLVAPAEREVQEALEGEQPVAIPTGDIERTRWATHDMRAGQRWL